MTAPSRLLVLLLLLVPVALRAEEAGGMGPWHRLVGILQYLEADYPLAAASGDAFELQEQKSFAAEAVDAARSLGPASERFLPRVQALQARILAGAEPAAVSRECGALVEELVLAGGLARSPRRVPDLAAGAQLYQAQCARCHGARGDGAGPEAAGLTPPPADFLSAEVMGGLSPYKAFNTTRFGIPGTPMPGFPQLSEEERWNVAFFLFTLRHPACEGTPPRTSLERLATSSDAQLAQAHGEAALPCLRHQLPHVDEEWALLSARDGVEEALRRGAAGDYPGARQALLDAYLQGLEPVEPKLRARDAAMVQRLEEGFLKMRLAAERSSPELQQEGRALLAALDEARRGSGEGGDARSVFWLAFFILLREGFEATIIVAALLALMRKMGADRQARVVHAGWVSALVAGALAYLLGRRMLAGANRELLEGGVALLAVGMLLYAALWLNARANMSQFMGELRGRMTEALGRGSTVGLFGIAFMAVFRESFETAIFLQGLALDSPRGVAWGAAAGVVGLVALVLFVHRVGFRLPMKTLFKASTVLLVGTAVILLGKGLRALQEVALLPVVPLSFVRIDLLGVYPDAVTLLPQVALALGPLVWGFLRRRTGRSGRPLADASPRG